MDHSTLMYLVWLCLAFGGMGLALTIGDYLVARIMKPQDEVSTENPRVTHRRADLIEQEERIKALGIELGNNTSGQQDKGNS